MPCIRHLLLTSLVALLPACATIMDGNTQGVSISTAPSGATCNVARNGASLGTIQTPGMVTVERSKNDLTVTCGKAGTQTVQLTQPAKFTGVTFGNVIAGGLFGVVVDAATGANYRYDNQMLVVLPPAVGPVSPMASANPSQVLGAAIW